MKKILLLLLLFIGLIDTGKSQNLPACDSLVIDCCTLNATGQNEYTLTVSNYSSVLFDYPAFVLFDSNMDTVAKEQVTYFGISQGPQSHVMNIMMPVTLPFTGTLNLYTWFHDTLACSFPITIPDTTTGVQNINERINSIKIIPNPANNVDEILIDINRLKQTIGKLVIVDMKGVEVKNQFSYLQPDGKIKLNIRELACGIFVLKFETASKVYRAKFVVTR